MNIQEILGLINLDEFAKYYVNYSIILIFLFSAYQILIKKKIIKANELSKNYLKYLPIIFGIDIIYRFISLGESYIYPLYVIWFFRYLLPTEKKWSIVMRRVLAVLIICYGTFNLYTNTMNNYATLSRRIQEVFKITTETIKNVNVWYLTIGTLVMVIQRILFSRTWVYIIEAIHGPVNRNKMMILHAITELPRYIPGVKYLNMLSRIYVLKKQQIKEVNSLLSFIYERKYNIVASVLLILFLLDKSLFREIMNVAKLSNSFINEEIFVFIQVVLLFIITLIILMYPKYLANFTQKMSKKLFNDQVDFKASKKQLNIAFGFHFGLAFMYAIAYYFQFKSIVPNLVFNLGLVALIYTVSQVAGSLAKDIGKILILPIRYAIIIILLKMSNVQLTSEQAYQALAVAILAFQAFMFYTSVVIYQIIMIGYALIVHQDIKEMIREVFSIKKFQKKKV